MEFKVEEAREEFGREVESITIEKNSRGINYKIKILGTDIDRLEEIKNKLEQKFIKGDGK